MNETPHVVEMSDGLRNVDILSFGDETELRDFIIQNFTFLDHGTEKYVFQGKEDSQIGNQIVLKIDINPQLSEPFWTDIFVSNLKEIGSDRINQILEARRKYWIGIEDLADAVRADSTDRVLEQIAAANSLYRRDSAATPPINVMVQVQGKPVGYFQKYVPGDTPKRKTARVKDLLKMSFDQNPNNVISNISPEVSSSDTQVVDVRWFVPSDSEIKDPPSILKKITWKLKRLIMGL